MNHSRTQEFFSLTTDERSQLEDRSAYRWSSRIAGFIAADQAASVTFDVEFEVVTKIVINSEETPADEPANEE